MLSDDILLNIFDFYRKNYIVDSRFCDLPRRIVWKWHVLVHICRRWRQVIFQSPRRLNVQILCTDRTPVQKNLGIWPPLPIVVYYEIYKISRPEDLGNISAALKHPDRVCHVTLNATGSQLAKVVKVMQEPFPVLTRLELISCYGKTAVLPAKFLAGTAPCLQEIHLYEVPFPALPSLLLSTSDLVTLTLSSVPTTGYISPEAIVEGLAALTKLETLIIRFNEATPHSNHIRPPINRIVLPALTYLSFEGAWEYLDDLVAQIDSPQLDRIRVTYLNNLVNVSAAQLSEFVDRSVGPKLTKFGHARVGYYGCSPSFIMDRLLRRTYYPCPDRPLVVISFQGSGPEVYDLTQLLGQFSTAEILSNVVHLKLDCLNNSGYPMVGPGAVNVRWPRLLHPFSAVQTLHVSQELAGIVADALEDITGETVAKVLPSLNSICLEGQSASSIGKFVAARGLIGRPVTVVDSETESN